MDSLQALLARLDYARSADRIWLVGDLVNRGPANAEVLRWCRQEEERVTVVLGNHDLHLLALAQGCAGQTAATPSAMCLQPATGTRCWIGCAGNAWPCSK